MIGVFLANVFDAEVIDSEAKTDWSICMREETGCVLGGRVTIFGEVLGEPVVCDDSCLRQSIHSFADFDQNVAIVYKMFQVVLLHDDLGNVFN